MHGNGWHGNNNPWVGRGGRGRSGPPPWAAELIRAFGGPGGPGNAWGGGPGGSGGRRGPKARRGDVRAACLSVLSEEAMNGYQVIQTIGERSGGVWRPSPGSVYPTIQQLEDEGLVEGRDSDGRRVLHLTDEGRAYVTEHAEELARTWRAFEESAEERAAASGIGELMPVVGQVMGAVWQVVTVGTEQQRAEAAEILGETRRRLYGLLADGDPE